MAQYPEQPTGDEQEALRSFVYLFARLYPWYARCQPDMPFSSTADLIPAVNVLRTSSST
jgi:hypothetical protein